MHYLAIIAAAIGSMAFGAGYYGALGSKWMASSGLTEDEVKNGGASPFIIAFLCELLIAAALAFILLMSHGDKEGGVSLAIALKYSFFIWLAFVMTTQIVNHRYGMRPWSLTIIDGGHWLGVFLIQAIIIALIV